MFDEKFIRDRMEEILYYALSSRFLDLIILPTEKCNFRCRYCYESFSVGKMRQDIVDGIVNLIKARAPSLDLLTIHFFGGEPLLAHNHIVQICQASMAAMEMGKFSYYAMATTNGYLLTLERANLYYSLGLKRYQITFDGTKDVRDLWRSRYGGGGTFDTIWSNLKGLRSLPHDLEVVVRLHLMPGREDDAERFVVMFGQEFGGDKRFKIFFKEVAHLGSINDRKIKVFNPTSSIYKNLVSYLGSLLPVENLDNQESDASIIVNNICYASRANSFVIRANGDVGKCTVALDSDRNRVGRILPDGRIILDSEAVGQWLVGLNTLRPDDLRCPLHAVSSTATPKVGSTGQAVEE